MTGHGDQRTMPFNLSWEYQAMIAPDFTQLELGIDISALPGMVESDILTPALIIDLDAFEDNVERMRALCAAHSVRHRAHAKMHRSVDVAKYQIEKGDAVGICCQKVSEAEVFVRAGFTDVMISNEVTDPARIDRLAKLPTRARILVCVDDFANLAALSRSAQDHQVTIEALVELDVGAGRCGAKTSDDAIELGCAIAATPGLHFAGIQAYHGPAQHLIKYTERHAAIAPAVEIVEAACLGLKARGLSCEIVAGAGTGTAQIEAASGIYNELQAGSYAFMDASYGAIEDEDGRATRAFRHALFVLTSVMSVAGPGRAVCDAGLKSQSLDSGLPTIWDRDDLAVLSCNDEHLMIEDPRNSLRLNDRLRLVPGHCDPTCNLHDWYVCVRDGMVETLWPVSARGKSI